MEISDKAAGRCPFRCLAARHLRIEPTNLGAGPRLKAKKRENKAHASKVKGIFWFRDGVGACRGGFSFDWPAAGLKRVARNGCGAWPARRGGDLWEPRSPLGQPRSRRTTLKPGCRPIHRAEPFADSFHPLLRVLHVHAASKALSFLASLFCF